MAAGDVRGLCRGRRGRVVDRRAADVAGRDRDARGRRRALQVAVDRHREEEQREVEQRELVELPGRCTPVA